VEKRGGRERELSLRGCPTQPICNCGRWEWLIFIAIALILINSKRALS